MAVDMSRSCCWSFPPTTRTKYVYVSMCPCPCPCSWTRTWTVTHGRGRGHGQISPVKYSQIYYIIIIIVFSKNNNFKDISLLSTFLTIFDIMSSHSIFFPFDVSYYSTFCPIRHFFHSTFCLIQRFFHSTFCPIRRFVFRQFVVWRFLFSAFVTPTFCRWTDVLNTYSIIPTLALDTTVVFCWWLCHHHLPTPSTPNHLLWAYGEIFKHIVSCSCAWPSRLTANSEARAVITALGMLPASWWNHFITIVDIMFFCLAYDVDSQLARINNCLPTTFYSLLLLHLSVMAQWFSPHHQHH
jgi:hypothetical protein